MVHIFAAYLEMLLLSRPSLQCVKVWKALFKSSCRKLLMSSRNIWFYFILRAISQLKVKNRWECLEESFCIPVLLQHSLNPHAVGGLFIFRPYRSYCKTRDEIRLYYDGKVTSDNVHYATYIIQFNTQQISSWYSCHYPLFLERLLPRVCS